MSVSARRFAIASENGQAWIDKTARGEPVTAAERNAFVAQAGAAMDALADPEAFMRAAGNPVQVPRTVYHGPVAQWNNREVPLVGTGTLKAPREWLIKGRSPATAPRSSGSVTLAQLLMPTNEERAQLYLLGYNVMKSLQGTGEVVERRRVASGLGRDAGLPIVPIVIVGVVGIICWGLYLYNQQEEVRIRESEETSRQARELAAAQQGWLQRVQYGMQHPGQPLPPPSPAEQRVQNRPYPTTPSPAERGSSNVLDELQRAGERALIWGGAGIVALTVIPPVVGNLADRATRERGGEW